MLVMKGMMMKMITMTINIEMMKEYRCLKWDSNPMPQKCHVIILKIYDILFSFCQESFIPEIQDNILVTADFIKK